MGYKLLVVGNIYDNHVVRYVSNLKNENPEAIIDILATKRDMPVQDRVADAVSDIYWLEEKSYQNKYLREFNKIRTLLSVVSRIKNEKQYDIVNIHFPIEEYFFVISKFRKMGKTLLITPWGSDVYRSGKRGRFFLKRVFSNADYVCGTGNRFSKDVRRIFNVPSYKFVNLDIGSETIDYIYLHKASIDTLKARTLLGIKREGYVITCGYNAHSEQNHLAILDAIYKIKDELPSDATLLFPMTYPQNRQYIETVKERVKTYSFNSLFFEHFLSIDQLFLMRQATDMFIHVQQTDANAQSVQEYILLGKNVVNGGWLRYDELEKDGIPYYVTDSLQSLSTTVMNAYKEGRKHISHETIDYIMSYGWKSWIKKWNTFFVQVTNNA